MRRVRIGILNRLETHSSISDDSFCIESEDINPTTDVYHNALIQKRNTSEGSFSLINKSNIYLNKEDMNTYDYYIK